MNKLPKELLDTQVFHVHFKPFTLGMSPKSKYKIDDLKRELQNIEQLLAKNIKIN